MASFFSDIGKQFQSAAKSVQKMTKDSLEASRLNGEIRALRDEQKKLLVTLGEAYYESRGRAQVTEQLDLIVKRIDQINERAKAITAELDQLSERKRCPKCDAVLPRDTKFCPSCGTKLPEPEPPKEPEPEPAKAEPEKPAAEFCTECGALRQENGRFCVVCGHPFAADARKPEVEINWPESGQETLPAEEPQAEEPPAEEPNEEHAEE